MAMSGTFLPCPNLLPTDVVAVRGRRQDERCTPVFMYASLS